MPTVIIETIAAFAIVGVMALLLVLRIPKEVVAPVLATAVFAILFVLHLL